MKKKNIGKCWLGWVVSLAGGCWLVLILAGGAWEWWLRPRCGCRRCCPRLMWPLMMPPMVVTAVTAAAVAARNVHAPARVHGRVRAH